MSVTEAEKKQILDETRAKLDETAQQLKDEQEGRKADKIKADEEIARMKHEREQTGRKYHELNATATADVEGAMLRALQLDRLAPVDDVTDTLPRERQGAFEGLNALEIGMAAATIKLHQETGEVLKGGDEVVKELFDSARRLEKQSRDVSLSFAGGGVLKETTTPANITGLRRVAVSTRIWESLMGTTRVAGLFRHFRMTSNPQKAPLDFARRKFKPGTQGTNPTETTLAISPMFYSAAELVDYVGVTYQTEVQSIIAFMPRARRNMIESYQETIEDVLINADPTNGTANINNSGTNTTIATAGFEHLFYSSRVRGLRARVLRDTTASNPRNVSHGKAMDLSAYSSAINAMSARFLAGRLVFIQDITSYLQMVTDTDSAVLTIDKLGNRATILTGQLASVFGVPIVVSDAIKPTQADGTVSSTAANNTKSSILAIDRTEFENCTTTPLGVQVGPDIKKRQTDMVSSAVVGFQYRTDVEDGLATTCPGAALVRNIGA